jgi:glutathione S-transferase
MAPHIALHEAGAKFRTQTISFAAHQQHDASFLQYNPLGKVPVLLVGAEPLTEVLAILYYVARTFPAANLWPFTNTLDEALACSWMSYLASTVQQARRQGRDSAYAVYRGVEARLNRGAWAVANQYSVADIHLFRIYWRTSASLNFDPDDFPALERHRKRMLARASVQATLAAEAAIGYELPDQGNLSRS